MSLRVHELAKDLKISSKELIDKFKSLKVDVKSHMSVLTDAEINLVKPTKKSVPVKEKTNKAPSKTPKQSTEKLVEMGGIESARKEFLLQRNAIKISKPAIDVKRVPVVEGGPEKAAPITRKPIELKPIKPKIADKAADKEEKRPPLSQSVKDVYLPAAQETSKGAFSSASPVAAPTHSVQKIELDGPITVKDLALKFQIKINDLIQRLIKIGIFANINQSVSLEIAKKVAAEIGFEIEETMKVEAALPEAEKKSVNRANLISRAPIVTLMGHVDHGKTSLLDAIRNTKVAAKEAGGITQHIGAYEVFLPKGAVTFLDTPGHEAFTAMRARGAKATDIVVLVVAADDGVMPQTIEAIDHAKAADVPIIVAINKIDLPSANPDLVKKALMKEGLMPEEWGGKVIMVGVSAKTGMGIDELLEMLVLEAELLELKADPTIPARGVVIEAQLSKESGVLATMLVQEGSLRLGDVVVVGSSFCRVRAMINDRAQRINEALPSMPVEILGLSVVPRAGDNFYVVKDEKTAREIFEKNQASFQAREKALAGHVTLEHLFEDIKAGKAQELKLILKADVQGSIEALRATLGKIQSKNVRLNIIHTATGDVSESDVMLAAASNAVVIGFHVSLAMGASDVADREGVDVRFYDIIYEVKTAIEKAMEGLLSPEKKEVFVGSAEVRQAFKVSKVGAIAGCIVHKGKIVRNYPCRLMRGGSKIHEGKIISLKRFKDDAREVLEGFECGIGVSNFNDFATQDKIEVYEIQEKQRKLE